MYRRAFWKGAETKTKPITSNCQLEKCSFADMLDPARTHFRRQISRFTHIPPALRGAGCFQLVFLLVNPVKGTLSQRVCSDLKDCHGRYEECNNQSKKELSWQAACKATCGFLVTKQHSASHLYVLLLRAEALSSLTPDDEFLLYSESQRRFKKIHPAWYSITICSHSAKTSVSSTQTVQTKALSVQLQRTVRPQHSWCN